VVLHSSGIPQACSEDAAGSDDVPTGHAVQPVAPAVDEKAPAAQLVHAVAPDIVEYCPTTQPVQPVELPTIAE